MHSTTRYIDNEIYNLIDTLEVARTVYGVKIALKEFTRQCGFDCYAFAQIRAGLVRVISNFPREWQHRYVACQYFALDPVVARAKRSRRPFTWSLAEMRSQGSRISSFADEAEQFGLRTGFAIPLRVGFGGTSILSLASSDDQIMAVSIRDLGSALTAIAFAHTNLVKLAGRVAGFVEIGLSPREATCLKWASLGKTKAETAVLVGLSERTVRFYLDHSMEKLEARNITQAVAVAVDAGLI